jgi:hypothetical protein
LKIAVQLCRDLPKMLATPIPTDPDVKRPVAVHGDNRGLMVLPEAKLRVADLAKAGSEVVPVGQLWLLKVSPTVAGQAVKAEKLQTVNLGEENQGFAPSLCALGVRKAADGRLELLIYGKEKEPLLHAPLAPISEKQADPITVSVTPSGDGLALELKILGSYTASVPLALAD